MTVIELVLTNGLGCEIGRYEMERDSLGYPLVLATVQYNVELRSALAELQVGDTLAMVERESN